MLSQLQACKKAVDLLPTDFINEDNVFQDVSDLEKGLYGVYSSFSGENTMYVNALISDEVKISSENGGQGAFDFYWQYNAENGSANSGWTNFYLTIGNLNKVLASVDKVQTFNASETTLKEKIRGELFALRAICHFELLQRYAARFDPANTSAVGIPYTKTSDIGARPSRNTIGEVLTEIENDLDASLTKPVSNSPIKMGDAGEIRLSKSVIYGYKARVALYKKDWAKAIEYANQCLDNSGKKTLADRIFFSSIWQDEEFENNEILFKLRRTGGGVGGLWTTTSDNVYYEPSDKLKALYNRTTDIRFESYFKISDGETDTALVYKFYNSTRGRNIVDVKLMRSAEMYLIIAEAYAESGDLTNAAQWYNDLRRARIDSYTDETFLNKEEAVVKILEERARELCFEGFRFFDLKRKGLPISRLSSDVLSTLWQNMSANDYRFLLPIPQASIFANPNLNGNNPGY
jgi:tetratricopeptide (TPR) repeat protein